MESTQNRLSIELPLAGRKSFKITSPLGESYRDRLDPMERAYNLRHLRSNLGQVFYQQSRNQTAKSQAQCELYQKLSHLSAETVETLSALSWSLETRIPSLITPRNVARLLEASQEAREAFVLEAVSFIAKQPAEWFPYCETREGIIARLEASVKGKPLFGYRLMHEFSA